MPPLDEPCASTFPLDLLRTSLLVLTQNSVEGKLERVDLTQEGKDHARGTANLYERI
jgi:hypothetical protein